MTGWKTPQIKIFYRPSHRRWLPVDSQFTFPAIDLEKIIPLPTKYISRLSARLPIGFLSRGNPAPD
jgi:hypothetical protein